ncbi:hypothetical protein ACQ86O_17755 [Serratia sp. L9]|uniref:hypothetical protein n=1 Tax=Serratia sp. L9 TaxID=3423946 RepID=UPI003D671747
MAAGNSTLNLALRITADMAEAKQSLEALAGEIKTTGANAEASNQQWKATAEAQQVAAEAARQHTQSQQALNTELTNSTAQSKRAAMSSEEMIATQNALRERGGALYKEEKAAEEAAAEAAKTHAKEVEKLAADLEKLLGSIDPASKALAKLDAQETQLRKSFKAGLIDEQVFNDNLGKLNDQRAAVDHLSEGTEKLSLNSRAAGRELRVLVHQLSQGNFRDASNNMFSLGARTGMLPPCLVLRH